MPRNIPFVLLFFVVCVPQAVVGQASFQGVGDLPGGSGRNLNEATAVSPDGTVVVGHSWITDSTWRAFRWAAETGIEMLESEQQDGSSSANAASVLGTIIVGWRSYYVPGQGDVSEAVAWVDGVARPLAGLPLNSDLFDVTPDGTVIVGTIPTYLGQEPQQAFRTRDGFVEPLGTGEYGLGSSAKGVSSDGSVGGGVGIPTGGEREAFRWENGVVTRLGDMQGGLPRSIARAVSADGRVIVGYGYGSPTLDRAFRWEDGVLVPLPDPIGMDDTRAYAVSADGRTIVGVAWASAVRWVDGVADELESPHAGSGTYQIIACAVSSDGRIIAGGGNTPSGQVLLRWVDCQVETLATGPGLNLSDPQCGISADGTTIVWGNGYFWRSGSGLSVLSDHLTQTLGLNLGGLSTSSVNGVSLDGLTVVGGGAEGWIAFLGRTALPTQYSKP